MSKIDESNGSMRKGFDFSDSLLVLAVLIIFVCFFIKTISFVVNEPFSFDGGMNAQVATSLISGKGYATNYNGSILFDTKIQSGPTIIFPVAISFLLFSPTFEAGQAINAIYLIMLFWQVYYLLKTCLRIRGFWLISVLLLLLITPGLFQNAFNLYGEIPALSFCLWAIIFFQKSLKEADNLKTIIISGIFLGFSILTKTVMLITLPAFFLVFLIKSRFFRKNLFHNTIQKLGLWFIGLLLPIIIFEIYRILQIGLNNAVIYWKTLLPKIGMQAGVMSGFEDSGNLVEKFTSHLQLLQDLTNINWILILISLSIIFLTFILLLIQIYRYSGEMNSENLIMLLIVFLVLCYLGWWLLITPTSKAWLRRIINGIILLEIGLPISFRVINTTLRHRIAPSENKAEAITFLNLSSAVCITLFACVLLVFKGEMNISFTPSGLKQATINAGNFIKELPEDSKVFGYGWWQSPLISFSSGRNFNDLLLEHDNKKIYGSYIVVDYFAEFLDAGLKEEIFNKYVTTMVFEEWENRIYRIIESKSAPFEKH